MRYATQEDRKEATTPSSPNNHTSPADMAASHTNHNPLLRLSMCMSHPIFVEHYPKCSISDNNLRQREEVEGAGLAWLAWQACVSVVALKVSMTLSASFHPSAKPDIYDFHRIVRVSFVSCYPDLGALVACGQY
jgi:hypothetical protein